MVDEQYETERKFLVKDPSIVAGHEGDSLRQAYLYRIESSEGKHEGRIRLVRRRTAMGVFEELVPKFTIKGPGKLTRPEYEMDIPFSYASQLFADSSSKIEKVRYSIVIDVTWEIDVFKGANSGLILAEYEAANAAVSLNPTSYSFLGEEVTNDPRYRNEYLAENPWPLWTENLRLGNIS